MRRAGTVDRSNRSTHVTLDPSRKDGRSAFIQMGSGVDRCGARANHRCAKRHIKQKAHIAVYTYNLGGYEEPRGFQVPCVPDTVDAFLFLDARTKRKAPKAALAYWKRQGWKLKIVPLEDATPYVSGDHDMTINLQKLPRFLEDRDDRPLLMLKWYWRDCEDDAFKCMMWEMNDMLTKRPEYVKSSRRNIQHWKELMRSLHEAREAFMPPHYYESCIIARNLKHEKAETVRNAFEKIYNMSHDIQRDQFLLPYYLWRHDLSYELEALHLDEMQEQLDMCSVPTKRKRN